ncbi:MAG: hypothetical protein AAGA56_17870 [Myxococcota bacterium]
MGLILGMMWTSLADAAERYELAWDAPPSCPSSEDVKHRIEELLGDSTAESSLRVRGRVRRQGERFVATLITVQRGQPGRRQFEAGSCRVLVEAVAVSIALAIDPLSALAPSSAQSPDRSADATPKPPAPSAPPTALSPPREPPPSRGVKPNTPARPRDGGPFPPAPVARVPSSWTLPPPRPSSWDGFTEASLGARWGSLPRVGFAPEAGFGIRWRGQIEGVVTVGASPAVRAVDAAQPSRGAAIAHWWVSTEGRFIWFRLGSGPGSLSSGVGLRVEAGQLLGDAFGAAISRRGEALWLASGPSGTLHVGLGRRLHLTASAALTFALVRQRFLFDQSVEIHRPDAVGARLATGIVYRFSK